MLQQDGQQLAAHLLHRVVRGELHHVLHGQHLLPAQPLQHRQEDLHVLIAQIAFTEVRHNFGPRQIRVVAEAAQWRLVLGLRQRRHGGRVVRGRHLALLVIKRVG